MPELERLQQAFGAALARAADAPRAAPLFVGEPGAVAERLAVYRGNSVGACTGALRNAYPIVAKIVGREFFDAMAQEYLRRHPSVSGDLNALGAELPAFVSAFAPTQDLPYLPDVARMEWAAHLAHYASDDPPLDLARLAAVPPAAQAGVRLKLASGTALLESPWPLARIWEVHQDDYAGEFAVDFARGLERILVHRPRFRVAVAALSAGEFAFLSQAQLGAPLAAALADALAPEPGFDLATAAARWVEARVISGIDWDGSSAAEPSAAGAGRFEEEGA